MAKNEVRNEVKGGEVEMDAMSFYTSPKTATTTDMPKTAEEVIEEKHISVFGVQISLM